MKDTIQMKFVCNEDFDAMKCTDKGRFCESCDKEIFDLTHLSVSEIRKMKAENPDLCGIMTIEQTDPDFIREVKISKRIKAAAFFTSIFFMTESHQAKAQHTKFNTNYYPIESFKDSTGKLDYKRRERNRFSVIKRGKPVEREDENGDIKEFVPVKYKRKTHYWSRRFPFLHRSRRFIAGKW